MTRRLHVVSLPHTRTTKAFSWCAFTEKVRKFCNMMASLDSYEVLLYAGEENEAACSTLVPVVDWEPTGPDSIPEFGQDQPQFRRMAEATIAALHDTLDGHQDYLCLIGGAAQGAIAAAFPSNPVVEFGVGYGGVLDNTYRVFESYAWMHTIYGERYSSHGADGRFFDAVIPNYFETADFPLGAGSGDYYLYLGRLVDRKGWRLAQEVCESLGAQFVVAGPGEFSGYGDYVGVVGPKERAELLGDAIATFTPSIYVEPFCGVHIESQLCGTPVITTDWGAFTETMTDERQGTRCRMFREFQEAALNLSWTTEEDRKWIRQNAALRWSTATIKWHYDAYFDQLDTLWGDGFYDERRAP